MAAPSDPAVAFVLSRYLPRCSAVLPTPSLHTERAGVVAGSRGGRDVQHPRGSLHISELVVLDKVVLVLQQLLQQVGAAVAGCGTAQLTRQDRA